MFAGHGISKPERAPAVLTFSHSYPLAASLFRRVFSSTRYLEIAGEYIYIYTYLSICYIARGALPRKNRDKVVYALKLCPSRSSLGKATLSEYSREAE